MRDPPPSASEDGAVSRRARFWLRLVAGLVLLGLIVTRIDRTGLTLRPTPAVMLGVMTSAGLLLLSQALAAWRWKLILRAPDLPWAYLVRLYVIAAFFNLLLPSAAGGDAVRATAAARGARQPGGVVVSVVVDRLFGVLALLIYAAVGLLVVGGVPPILTRAVEWRVPPLGLAAGALGLVLVAWLGLRAARRSCRVATIVDDGFALGRSLLRAPGTVLAALGLAMVVQGLVILIWATLARSLDLAIPLTALLVAVPLVTLGSMLPITLSGLGVREGIWLLLLGGSGLPPGTIVGFSLLYFATAIVVGLVGLTLFVSLGMGPRAGPGIAEVAG
jgi:glycosyltransferase 2 family protein